MRGETITNFGKTFSATSASIRPTMSIGPEPLDAEIRLPVRRAIFPNPFLFLKFVIPRNGIESELCVTPELQHDKHAINQKKESENSSSAGKG
jgi:hypothetical protein